MQYHGHTNEFLSLEEITAHNCYVLKEKQPSALTLVWMLNDQNILTIDGKRYQFEQNTILCLTEFHQVEVNNASSMRMVRFNRSFYCILDHDSEIGCKGILFFGASNLPYFKIPDEEVEKLELFWKTFSMEMLSRDTYQIEMLQAMLKRLLILCTRIYKTQKLPQFPVLENQVDLIREFNFLVETHFKTKHTVGEYAAMLHKSPKTLSNLFSKTGNRTPLQIIQERRMIEARRLLRYSDFAIKEIAAILGYEEIQAFSRFFKSHEGIAPSEYRASNKLGNMDTSAGKIT